VGHTKPIDAAKAKIPPAVLAERLSGPGGRRGREVFFRCPLHDDTSPSLRVDPAKGVWYCDPCGRGGDVVELARLAWEYPVEESAVVAAVLLMEFGHEVPQRPPPWFRRQERQKPVRDAIEQARFEHLRRRLFRRFFAPSLAAIEDTQERDEEAAILWDATDLLTRLLLRNLEERRAA
jgi:hypothetical protein